VSDTGDTTTSWQFIGRRLDVVQADTADIRRRMATLIERFSGLADRLDEVGRHMASLERRQTTLEERMDAIVDRQSKLELTGARTLYLLQRLAAKSGVEDDT